MTGAVPPATAPGLAVERDTWRPIRTDQVGGWLLGFTDGLTRRANSAVPAVPGAELSDDHLAEIERRYTAAGQPTVFRICSAAPDGLDDRLAARGYVEGSITEVWVREIADRPGDSATTDHRIAEADRPDAAWLDGWLGVKTAAAAADRYDVATRLLAASPARYLTARAEDGAVLGVVRVALPGDWAGFSCLAVTPAARRRGIGRALTVAGLDAAARAAATRAFLQVEVHNTAALALYRALTFRPAARYSYWEH